MIEIGGIRIDPDEISRLPLAEQREILKLLNAYERQVSRTQAREKFHSYQQYVMPGFVDGRHIREISSAFDAVMRGELKRVIMNLAPRHMKSKQASVHLPGFFIGHFPERKIIQASNTADLAKGFGREVRDLISGERHQEVFPQSSIKSDAKAAGYWKTPQGGEYYAVGVEGAIAGRGAHLLGIDDPHSDQEGLMAPYNPKVFDKAWEWYQLVRQRMQPGGAILQLATRWGKRDLTGRIIEHAIENGSISDWKIFEFPAIMPSGKPLWPEFWSIEELLSVKRDIAPSRWNAQYQQQPTSEQNAVVPRSAWRPWEGRPPECEFIIQAWDTAYTSKTSADYSACATWGIFHTENAEGKLVPNAILLHAYRNRMEFPQLKEIARELYRDWRPDSVIIEAKSAGLPLLYELRMGGIPCQDYTPTKGADKLVRLNSVADLFTSGLCWFSTDSKHINAIERTIDELNDFPSGTNDDLLDATVMCLMRFKQGLFIGESKSFDDEPSDDEQVYKRVRRYY